MTEQWHCRRASRWWTRVPLSSGPGWKSRSNCPSSCRPHSGTQYGWVRRPMSLRLSIHLKANKGSKKPVTPRHLRCLSDPRKNEVPKERKASADLMMAPKTSIHCSSVFKKYKIYLLQQYHHGLLPKGKKMSWILNKRWKCCLTFESHTWSIIQT